MLRSFQYTEQNYIVHMIGKKHTLTEKGIWTISVYSPH